MLFRLALALVVPLAVTLSTTTAAARPLPKLSPAETRALFAERAVVTRLFETRDDAIALVAYVVIDAPPEAVLRALGDPAAYPAMLPMNRSAKPARPREGRDQWMALEHGTDLAHADFVVRVRAPDHASEDPTVRFWLDPSFEHDIDRAWGFFRVSRLAAGRALLAHGAAVDLGSPIWKLLFTGLVKKHAQRTPELVRGWVEAHKTP